MFICNFYFLGVDDRVKADKRKSRNLHCDEKKSCSHKGEQIFCWNSILAHLVAHFSVKTIFTLHMCDDPKWNSKLYNWIYMQVIICWVLELKNI